MEKFVEDSYQRNATGHEIYSKNSAEHELAATWLGEGSVDYWRHERMYRLVDPLLRLDQQATWLTIGDGRFGCDAIYLSKQGAKVLPTDISETLLREAVERGIIKEYRIENAEKLSFATSSFDYVYCKESFHHFPRPYVALHEMLRVASKGVILVEPNDKASTATIKNAVLHLRGALGHYLGKDKKRQFVRGEYEAGASNFIFTISKKEIIKIGLALNYKYVVFKGINDAYVAGCEYEKLSDNGPLQKEIKRKIRRQDRRCRWRLTDYGLLGTMIFKSEPTPQLLDELQNNGYEIYKLSENPYI
jgi:ubiquinone/menaquinone biosynthesis C-methylase UbiE